MDPDEFDRVDGLATKRAPYTLRDALRRGRIVARPLAPRAATSVADAWPAMQDYFARYPDDAPRDAEHMRELARLTIRLVRASEALWAYVELVGGKPSRN